MDNKTLKALVDRLADKTLGFGCYVDTGGFSKRIMISKNQAIGNPIIGDSSRVDIYENPKIKEVLGHPILIGTVLEKMYSDKKIMINSNPKNNPYKRIIDLWLPCGLSKSLQEIVEESGYEKGYIHGGAFRESDCSGDLERLKSPQARALVDFLASIFLTDER